MCRCLGVGPFAAVLTFLAFLVYTTLQTYGFEYGAGFVLAIIAGVLLFFSATLHVCNVLRKTDFMGL